MCSYLVGYGMSPSGSVICQSVIHALYKMTCIQETLKRVLLQTVKTQMVGCGISPSGSVICQSVIHALYKMTCIQETLK